MAQTHSLHIERFKRLPRRSHDAWQGGIVRSRIWIDEPDGTVRRPWAAIWVSVATGLVNVQLAESGDASDPALALQVLVDLGLKLVQCRPARLEVVDRTLGEAITKTLADPELTVTVRADLPDVDRVLREMERHMRGGAPAVPDALDAPGMTAERMRAFAEAARDFYLAAPWQHLSDEDLVHVEAPAVDAGLRYFTVLGAAGQTFGLAFFKSPKEFDALHEATDPFELVSRAGKWSMLYGRIDEMPFGDIDLWENERLAVAGPSAYPVAMRYGPREERRRPHPQELADLTAILHALARTSEAEIDRGRWSHEVPDGDGKRMVTLAIPELLAPLDERFGAALEKAQELVYRAFEARGRRRIQLARKALELSADCADAYVILAEASHGPDAARALFEQAVAAGERALGSDVFTKEVGNFWEIMETRPYMRARFGLAGTLETLNRRDEAIEHYRALLRLNPGDGQNVRYSLLTALLLAGRADEALRHIEALGDEPTAIWRYGRVLAVFMREGDSSAARECLHTAMRGNRHVPRFLTDEADVPHSTPVAYSIGSVEEAMICDAELGEAWRARPEAIRWLRVHAPARRSKKKRRRRGRP